MTEQQALQEHIRAHPDDDTARLVFADWLDENGKSLSAARIRWWVGAQRHVKSPPTSGAGAMLGVDAGRQEREGLHEWVARLNQVKGVREALAGTAQEKHPGLLDALHAAELKAVGLSSLDDDDFARFRARGLDYSQIGTHAYDAANLVLRADAHDPFHYAPWHAQHARSGRTARLPRARHHAAARDAAHDQHQLETQRLVEYTHHTPPPADADHVKLARPIGWLKDKVAAWLSKKTPRDSRDGIVFRHAEKPTEVYAEKNAVAQALRLLGAGDRVDPAKVDRYVAHVARFVNENPDHNVVKEYKDKAGVLGGTAGPELTAAVKPLVGVVNLLLAAHGLDERFKRPESEAKPKFPIPAPAPAAPSEPAPAEAPISLDVEPAGENVHVTVHRLLQEHKDLNKVKAALKADHGMTHAEAHEATRNFLALHTGMKGFKSFQKAAKKNPDAKLAKPKAGEALKPEHVQNVAYGRKPINTALEGTALAYHLRQIGQDHPELAPLTDAALAREGVAGADPFHRIGVRLKQKSDDRAGLFNWSQLGDHLIQDAKVRALVKQHIVQGYKTAGEDDLSAERRYWDSVHRGLNGNKAKNAEQAWSRLVKSGGGLTQEQIADSIRRLKDRALDQEYSQVIRREGKVSHPEWRVVMGSSR